MHAITFVAVAVTLLAVLASASSVTEPSAMSIQEVAALAQQDALSSSSKLHMLDALRSFEVTSPVKSHSHASLGEHISLLHGMQDENGLPLHMDVLHFDINVFGQNLRLRAEKNRALFSPRFRLRFDGETTATAVEHCYYTGSIDNDPESVLSFSTCGDGVDGFFFHKGDKYEVMPVSKHALKLASMAEQGHAFASKAHAAHTSSPATSSLLVWRHSDISPDSGLERGPCQTKQHHSQAASDETAHTVFPGAPMDEDDVSPAASQSAASRSLLQTTVNYVELLTVVDRRQYLDLGSDGTAATQYAVKIVNGVNALYAKLPSNRVNVALTVLEIWTTTSAQLNVNGADPNGGTDIGDYLDAFTSWASSNNQGDLEHDNAQLLTGYDLSGGTAGIAWVGTMCGGASSGVNEAHATSDVWSTETMTHEMGHNFGADHDGNRNSCAPDQFVMAAIGSVTFGEESKLTWSTCSDNYISSKIQSLRGTPANCLGNSPDTIVGSTPVCGDMIVSGNEECDVAVDPVRCTAECKFKASVQCTEGECCSASGTFKPAGTVCRSALHQCDIADVCDGSSAECPTNLVKPDGTTCTEAGPGGKCYSGSCLGVDGQCIELGYSGAGNCQNECGDILCSYQGSCYYTYVEGANGEQIFYKIKDKTPCDTDKYCRNDVCVTEPAAVSCSGGCGNGVCSSDTKSSTSFCHCNPGWTGDECDEVAPCDVDCASVFREKCVPTSSTACGPCLEGRSTRTQALEDPNEKCWLQEPNATVATSSSGDLFNSPHTNVFDGDFFSHWIASLDSEAESYPFISFEYDRPIELRHYEVMSSNSLVQDDPKAWSILATNDVDESGDPINWKTLQKQKNIAWEDRHLWKTFPISKTGKYQYYRFMVTGVRGDTSAGDGSVDSSTRVQVAEIRLYEDPSRSSGSSESKVGVAVGATIAVFVVLGLIVAGCMYSKKRKESPSLRLQENASAPAVPRRPVYTNQGRAPMHEGGFTGVSGPVNPAAVTSASVYGYGVTDAPGAPVMVQASSNSMTLPPGWHEYTSDEGHVYFFNETTGESRWERPE